MASVSLIEGIAKKFINMVPRPFYTEAAQKLVHEICETIYKELENNGKRIPREEIIKIVEQFITAHLLNTDTEDPSGIRKAIEDSLKKTTLELYKDDIVNMLLLQTILSEEFDSERKPKADGIFYQSLEQSIINANDPTFSNRITTKLVNIRDNINKKLDENINNPINNKISELKNNLSNDKSKAYAKNVLDVLTSEKLTKGGTLNYDNKNQLVGGTGGIFNVVSENAVSFAKKNPLMAAAGMAVGAAMLNKSQNNSGNGSGSGNGNGGITNIGYEPNKNGVLPYIQTNCNGSGLGLGLPSIDLDFLGKILDGLKEPIAEELVKKIQERLPENTIDSITVKSNIYNKILLVIQAHLQSQDGKDMLLGHINRIIKPEVDILTNNDEIKKRLIKVIFKNKSSEIYKKLIDIIATNTSPPKEDATKEDAIKEDAKITNKNNEKFNTNISKVITDLYAWIDDRIKQSNGFPETKSAIKEAAKTVFKAELEKQTKKMEEENKKQVGETKKAIETGIQQLAIESVNAKIKESNPPAKEVPEINIRILGDKSDDGNEIRPAETASNTTNDDKIKATAISQVSKNLDEKKGGLSPKQTSDLPPLKLPPHLEKEAQSNTINGGKPNTKKRRAKHNKTKKKNRKNKQKK